MTRPRPLLLASWRMRGSVGEISSAADDREELDCRDEISIHESATSLCQLLEWILYMRGSAVFAHGRSRPHSTEIREHVPVVLDRVGSELELYMFNDGV